MKHEISFLALTFALIASPVTVASQDRQAGIKHEIVLSTSKDLIRGNEQLRLKNPEKAIKLYKRVLAPQSSARDKANAYNGLCAAHNMMEEWDKALESCNKAISLFGTNWTYYNNRGNAQLGMDHVAKALESYNKGLQIKPDSDILKTNLEIAKKREKDRG